MANILKFQSVGDSQLILIFTLSTSSTMQFGSLHLSMLKKAFSTTQKVISRFYLKMSFTLFVRLPTLPLKTTNFFSPRNILKLKRCKRKDWKWTNKKLLRLKSSFKHKSFHGKCLNFAFSVINVAINFAADASIKVRSEKSKKLLSS